MGVLFLKGSMEDIRFEVVKKIAQARFKYKDIKNISNLSGTSPPSVFIGSKLKYPLVNVGILSPLQRDSDAWVYDDAKYWAQNNFTIHEVVNLRDNLLNSRFQSKVSDSRGNNKFVEIAKEVAIASKPVDVEIELKHNFNVGRKKDRVVTPMGMHAPLKKARITQNVKVDQKLDKMMNDEVKSSFALAHLYKNKFSEYALSKILSVGVLGLKKDKKLVPTRWSITATDDTIGKHLLESIRNFKVIEDYEFYFGSFLGNHYLILFFPHVFSYELFEIYFPGSSWNPGKGIKASTDFEDFSGRKNYASNTAGGYYAARLGILEHLFNMKRQAGVLAIRLETPSYWAGLGVWVVRESVRKALERKALKFESIDEIVESSRKIGMIKFGFDNKKILDESKLLEQIRTQKSLREWF